MAHRKSIVTAALIIAAVCVLGSVMIFSPSFRNALEHPENGVTPAGVALVAVIALLGVASAIAQDSGNGKPMPLSALMNGSVYTFQSETVLGGKFIILAATEQKSIVVFESPASLGATRGDKFMRASSHSVAFVSRFAGTASSHNADHGQVGAETPVTS